MGCVSSKLFREEFDRERVIIINAGAAPSEFINHVVSLRSSTYGALKLETENEEQNDNVSEQRSNEPEIINASEFMDGLEEGLPISQNVKKSPKGNNFVTDLDGRSPLKLIKQTGSPRKPKSSAGKENRENAYGVRFYTPKKTFRDSPVKSYNEVFNFRLSGNETPFGSIRETVRCDSSRRKSLSPLFDPELVALYEKELSDEGEQIKRIISPSPNSMKAKKSRNRHGLLEGFEKKCPHRGENSVVIYTTTLRGIRKTFEDCNTVRSIIESHGIRMYERDVSMDSGYKEELRKIMGTEEVKIPVVFVKGRLIGGVDEVVKLEEEGKLRSLFDGIPRALTGCEGCGGIRFVMCMECNGSCKVLDEEKKKMVRCGECNENGLIQCPLCCLVRTWEGLI